MPTGLKVVILINIIATALIGLFAIGIGGGFALAVFPPDLRIEPVPAATLTQRASPAGLAADRRDDAPREAGAYDLGARHWEIGHDGSLRVLDDSRDLPASAGGALDSAAAATGFTNQDR